MPLTEEDQPMTASQTIGSSAACRGRLLVVDDDPVVLESIVRMMETRGWSVEKVSDGAVAAERVRSHPERFDAIVLDYSMPGVNGIEVIQELRGCGVQTPVILCSGAGTDRGGDFARDAGADAYIEKPYRLATLEDAILSVVPRST